MGRMKQEEAAAYRLRELYEAYGYSRYKMSKFEEYDLYVRNKSFLVSDHIITFTDTNGKLMALKPDVTLSIVKNMKPDGGVQKVHYNENVYRVSRGTDSYKEIPQVGLECLGKVGAYEVSEVLLLAVRSLEALREDCILEVSHLGILSAVLEEMGASAQTRSSLLACVGEKNFHGISEICREENLSETKLLTLLRLSGRAEEVLPRLRQEFPCAETADLAAVLSAVPLEKVRIDFSLVGDTNYYNGLVFRGYLSGVPAGILTGGQYDKLMQKMGKTARAIGFAVYLDLLEELREKPEPFDVDAVLLYDETDPLEHIAAQMKLLTEEGLRVTARRSLPEKLRWKKLLKLTESGVQTLENNA